MNLLLALVLSQAPEFSAEASGAYNASLRPAFGGFLGGTAARKFSDHVGAELGVLAGYQAEPYPVFDAYLAGAHSMGATHRLSLLATVGPRFALWRFTLSPQVLVGWTKVWLDGRFVNERWGIDAPLNETVSAFTLGIAAAVSFRIVERVHVRARVLVPLPFSSGVTGYVTFTLGAVVDFP